MKVNSGFCLNSKSFNYWYFFGHLDHSECVFDCNVALKEKLKQFHILLDDRSVGMVGKLMGRQQIDRKMKLNKYSGLNLPSSDMVRKYHLLE